MEFKKLFSGERKNVKLKRAELKAIRDELRTEHAIDTAKNKADALTKQIKEKEDELEAYILAKKKITQQAARARVDGDDEVFNRAMLKLAELNIGSEALFRAELNLLKDKRKRVSNSLTLSETQIVQLKKDWTIVQRLERNMRKRG